jgi:hypothetical protein
MVKFGKDRFHYSPKTAKTEIGAGDTSFTIRRYSSTVNSPSYIQIKPITQKTQEGVFMELLIISIKSGLARINTYELISKLKYLAYREVYKFTLKEFLAIVTNMSQYSCFPPHHLKIIQQYLTTLFKIFDPKSNSPLTPIDTGEVSYRSIGRGLIILCGGSLQDKLDAIGVLYEEYGIQEIESTEMADLCEGVLKLYQAFDSKSFEGTNAAEISSRTTVKCWEDLGVHTLETICPNQLKLLIEESKIETERAGLSKSTKRTQLYKTFEQSLKKLLHNKDLFKSIEVSLK